MSSRIRPFVAASALALVSAACSTTSSRPATDAATPTRALVACPGGTVRTPEQAAAFYACESITGDLRIEGSELVELGSFEALTEVSGTLSVENNPNLRSLSGLENVSAVGALRIVGNPRLESVSALEALTLSPRVEIAANPRLVNLRGLDGVERVDTLAIHGNQRLISVAGLGNLQQVGSLSVSENPRLCAKLGLFPKLSEVSELSVTRNFGLSSADLDALRARVRQGSSATEVALAP